MADLEDVCEVLDSLHFSEQEEAAGWGGKAPQPHSDDIYGLGARGGGGGKAPTHANPNPDPNPNPNLTLTLTRRG